MREDAENLLFFATTGERATIWVERQQKGGRFEGTRARKRRKGDTRWKNVTVEGVGAEGVKCELDWMLVDEGGFEWR